MANFFTQIPGVSNFFGLPFNGNILGNKISDIYSGTLSNAYNKTTPFTSQFEPTAAKGLLDIFNQLPGVSADKYTKNLFDLANTKITENYNNQNQSLKENMYDRGFGQSSSYALMQDLLNKGRSRDTSEAASLASLQGQQMANNERGSLQNLGTWFAGIGNNASDQLYNWLNLFGNQSLDFIGRQNDLTNNMMTNAGNLYSLFNPSSTTNKTNKFTFSLTP